MRRIYEGLRWLSGSHVQGVTGLGISRIAWLGKESSLHSICLFTGRAWVERASKLMSWDEKAGSAFAFWMGFVSASEDHVGFPVDASARHQLSINLANPEHGQYFNQGDKGNDTTL